MGARVRERQRLLGAAGAALLAGSGVAALGLSIATRPHTVPVKVGAATTTVVSYHGVQIHVPRGWPIEGGNRAPVCEPSFPADPTVFVGIQPLASLECPGPGPGWGSLPSRPFNGVWLQTDTGDGAGRETVTWPTGRRVGQSAGPTGPGASVSYHGVSVSIGAGTDPSAAAAILRTLAYRRGAPDTTFPGECLTNRTYRVMPHPTRLDHQLTFNRGITTINPPSPADHPAQPASIAWNNPQGGVALLPTSSYRLLLGRISSKFPATERVGQMIPETNNVLAWIIYTKPVSAANGSCGFSALVAFDATTGAQLAGGGSAIP